MGRIRLHQIEYDRIATRLLTTGILVTLLGLFSCLTICLVGAEAGTLQPLANTNPYEWDFEAWTRVIPVCLALVVVPGLAALVIGLHTFWHGGLLGFFASLFSLLPLPVSGGQDVWSAPAHPAVWLSLLLGMLAAFYVGDLGSWLCRRRRRREAMEEEMGREGVPA